MRELPGQRVPRFKVGGGDEDPRQVRLRCAREQRGFRARYADDRRPHAEGDRNVVFPYGTYAMRAMHGAEVEGTPPPDAILAAPGPLPGDAPVQAWTEHDRRQAMDEADSLLGADELPVNPGSATAPRSSVPHVRPAVDTTTREARRRLVHAEEHAERLVTLRDRGVGDPDPAPS